MCFPKFAPPNQKKLKMKNLLMALCAVFAITTSFYLSPTTTKINSNNPKNSDTLQTDTSFSESENTKISASEALYASLDFGGHFLNKDVFTKALNGFEKLKTSGKISTDCHLLTVCDFSLSSNIKRLWVIDTQEGKILFNSLVAHGMGTGEEFAEKFSNTDSSHQSSLGFYITESTYNGNNGYSLKLIGMDKGFNDAAYKRAVVMHGADYVSEDFAKQHKRIGRSWGCPAVPRDLAAPIINTIKQNNVLFIYYPDQNYLNSSEWLKS